ncbi:MAG: hypothetical protein BWY84_00319 [Candidatus Aerophobetes bacterium ADurb.Bin490]|nr:MAG: hypothetical protein BWY84_00319 [Candidatus Aerophobetes bacterium ADurb.Bin490]HPI04023.1 DUF3795 domain-containing protein [Candidatus Goldiibacteriota bacterium]HPN63852.1 DUF3795 domain-containing protein [Candidatus Goldiibacteriota bacterium]HRQ43027.1 DUF3795 domain-containing protein [Candidatus Goldiibacteriota bacterium]
MKIKHPETGICGLSCRLCPNYQTDAKSRCPGCKSDYRMSAGCPFITCAVKNKGIEFCWDCEENKTCVKWKKHREAGKKHDSFKCYQALENDIAFIQKHGVKKFIKGQKVKEKLLKAMLKDFNDGRSKSYYCIAATVMKTEELRQIIIKAKKASAGINIKERAKVLHKILDETAAKKKYFLKLRK